MTTQENTQANIQITEEEFESLISENQWNEDQAMIPERKASKLLRN